MYDNIKELITNRDYEKAKSLLMEQLKKDDNPDLWYLLFLADNDNYLDFDSNNIKNDYAYNQALRSDNDEYELEYKLYKELSLMNLNKVFRLIQLGIYDEVDNLLNQIKIIEFKLSIISSEYLIDIMMINDDIKLKKYIKLINTIYKATKGDNVLIIRDRLMGYINQKGINFDEKIVNKYTKKNISINTNDFDIENGILKKYKGNDSEVIIPSYVTEIGTKAFYYCKSLRSITIPNTVKLIRNRSFYNCCNLISVEIPEGVEYIGEEAFYDCSRLLSVVIPSTVKIIDEKAFYSCRHLVEIFNFSKLIVRYVDYKVIHTKKEPSNLIYVDDYIFFHDDKNYYLMDYLGNEKELSLPKDINGYNYVIDCYAFIDNTNITNVSIPKCVIGIGKLSFYGCNNLRSIVLPEGVTSIGDYAFEGCSNLVSITIPSTVKNVGNEILTNCNSLKYIYCSKNNIDIIKKPLSFTQRLKIKKI